MQKMQFRHQPQRGGLEKILKIDVQIGRGGEGVGGVLLPAGAGTKPYLIRHWTDLPKKH